MFRQGIKVMNEYNKREFEITFEDKQYGININVWFPIVWFTKDDVNAQGDYFQINFEKCIEELKTDVNAHITFLTDKLSEQKMKIENFQEKYENCLELRKTWLKQKNENDFSQTLTDYLIKNEISSKEAESFIRKIGSYENRINCFIQMSALLKYYTDLKGHEKDLYDNKIFREKLTAKLRGYLQNTEKEMLINTKKRLREHYEDVLYEKACKLVYWAYGKMIEDIHEVIGDDIKTIDEDEKNFACKQLRKVLNYIQFKS